MLTEYSLGSLATIKLIGVGVVLLLAVYSDVRSRRIPNAVTFPAILFGLTANIVGAGLKGAAGSLLGILAGALLLLVPVAFRWWGAGDLKLLASLGAIGGPMFILSAGLFSLVAGGVMALGVLLARRQTVPVVAGIAVDIYTRQAPKATSGIRLPYAIPIAIGTLIALVVR